MEPYIHSFSKIKQVDTLKFPISVQVNPTVTDIWVYPSKINDTTFLVLSIRRIVSPYYQKNFTTQEEDRCIRELSAKARFGDALGMGSGRSMGSGSPGNGIDVAIGTGLGARKLIKRPRTYPVANKEGKVAIKICVDPAGEVVSADYSSKESTTNDAELLRMALNAAKQYRFEPASLEQCGNILFKFSLK